MRVVVAPDKFTGSLTAVEAAEAIGEGLRRGRPGVAAGYDGSPPLSPARRGNG
jgi:glycerate kinase